MLYHTEQQSRRGWGQVAHNPQALDHHPLSQRILTRWYLPEAFGVS